jgi:glycosyltransferase involved in cell wall biosynthesis
MLNNKTIGVVVPAYNEETQIVMVIETMPDYVDRIVIVNDASPDKTLQVVRDYLQKEEGKFGNEKIGTIKIEKTLYNEADLYLEEMDRKEIDKFVPSEIVNEDPANARIILINQLKNGGVGSAIARGYKWCKDNNIDCTAVMAGDGQMDPGELIDICTPVLEEGIDYVKGNRLIHRSAKQLIPKTRYFGNSVLSMLTKLASGYWRVSDTQTGYTAISLNALRKIDIAAIYKSYGMPNDMLVKLNIAKCSLKEVEIKPIYRVGEQSKMKIFKLIPRVSWLLFKAFFKRIWIRYFKRDFHPLFLLYWLSMILFAASIPFLVIILMNLFVSGPVTANSILLIYIFLVISGFQSLLFAMWMDIQDNDRLQN